MTEGPAPRNPRSANWANGLAARWRSAEFATRRRRLRAAFEASLAAIPEVPLVRAGYYHDYFCTDHGVELSPSDTPGLHVCPLDGRTFGGDRIDLGRLWSVNNLLSRSALSWSLFAAVEPGPESAAARVALQSVLLDYVAAYSEVADHPGGLAEYPGLITFSGLDESVWLVRIAWAYGLARDWLPAVHRAAIESGLLVPAAAHLRRIRCPPAWPPIDNIALWSAAALIAASAAVGDAAGIATAVDGPLGLHEQLDRGVLADGLWWEGSLGYHYYSLAATVWAVRTLRAVGSPIGEIDVVRRMFAGPLELAFPDDSLPSMNDGWHDLSLVGGLGHDVPSAAGFRATARAWFDRPGVPFPVLGDREADPDADLATLLDGLPLESPGNMPATGASRRKARHRVFDTGPVVLRAADAMAVLKAGPAGGSHGHPDQLALQLFARGQRILDDMGTVGYGTSLNTDWYRATASHSTVIVDGSSQPATDGHGRSRALAHGAAAAAGSATWHDWPSNDAGSESGGRVGARRHVGLTSEYLLDIIEVECDRRRQLDWLILPQGSMEDDGTPNGAPHVLGTAAGYGRVIGQRLVAPGERMRWRIGHDVELTVLFDQSAAARAEVRIVGQAPGNPASDPVGVAVRRRIARTTTFRAVLAFGIPGDSPPRVSWAIQKDRSEVAVVALRDRTDFWSVRDGLLWLRRRVGGCSGDRDLGDQPEMV